MIKVVYYTSGLAGSGRIIKGISIGNGFVRNNIPCDYVVISSCSFGCLAAPFGFHHIGIPYEEARELSRDTYEQSVLYNTIRKLSPDILIVDLQWFSLHQFISDFPCKKVFLCTNLNKPYIQDVFLTIKLPSGTLRFLPSQYDLLVAAEPLPLDLPMKQIDPLIIRNRDEILSENEAGQRLGLTTFKRNTGKTCLVALNGKPGDFEEIKKNYSYLEDVGYKMVYSTNYDGGLFPAADYFNVFDLLITGGGYNSFWESIFFEKETIFVPAPRQFEDQKKRIDDNTDYEFKGNGVDQLVELIMNL